MSSLKSKSNRKVNFKKVLSRIGDFREKILERKIEREVKELQDEEMFSPRTLVNMVRILSTIEEIEKQEYIEEAYLTDLGFKVRPALSHIIEIYQNKLWWIIQAHFEQAVSEDILEISYGDESVWHLNPFLQYFLNKAEVKKKIQELEADIGEEAKYEVLMIHLSDLSTSAFDLNDTKLREAFFKYWGGELDVKNWLQAYDLMDAINIYIEKDDDELLEKYMKNYKSMFLTEKTFHSELILFKELEEFIRDLEHHNKVKIINEILKEYNINGNEFYRLLGSYGVPTLEEWNEMMEKLLSRMKKGK